MSELERYQRFRCDQCGRIEDLPLVGGALFTEKPGGWVGVDIQQYRLADQLPQSTYYLFCQRMCASAYLARPTSKR